MSAETIEAPDLQERSTIPAIEFEVGQSLTSTDQFERLPLGTIVRWRSEEGQHYIKTDSNLWNYCSPNGEPGGAYGANDDFATADGYNRIAFLPEPEGLGVGDSVPDREALLALPLGTVLRSTRTESEYEVIEGQRYRNLRTGRTSRLGNLNLGGGTRIRVASLPGGVTFTGEVTASPAETLAEFKQRFRTVTMGAAANSGVSREPLHAAFRKLEVPELEPAVGMHVCISDTILRTSLPSGTVLVMGDDPSNWNRYGVYRYSPTDGFVRMLGGANYDTHTVLRIEQGPGLADTGWAGEVTDRSQCEREVHGFKQAAWRLGLTAKSDNRWCGEYEAAMARVGITNRSVRDMATLATAEEVAAMPEGTILRYGNGIHTVLYRRDDSSTNPAKTVRLFGTIPGAWAPRMAVLFRPGGETQLRDEAYICSAAEMDAAPEGTNVVEGSNTTHEGWTKRADGTWQNGDHGYSYTPSSFSLTDLRYNMIGGLS